MRSIRRDNNPVIKALKRDNMLKELVRRFDFKRIEMIIQYCSVNQLINCLKRVERIKKRETISNFKKNFKTEIKFDINNKKLIAADYILGFFDEYYNCKRSILNKCIEEWKCIVQEKNIVAEYFVEAFNIYHQKLKQKEAIYNFKRSHNYKIKKGIIILTSVLEIKPKDYITKIILNYSKFLNAAFFLTRYYKFTTIRQNKKILIDNFKYNYLCYCHNYYLKLSNAIKIVDLVDFHKDRMLKGRIFLNLVDNYYINFTFLINLVSIIDDINIRILQKDIINRLKKKCKKNIVCSICLENVTVFEILPCGHKFHRSCILRWLRKSETCPMCRESFGSRRLQMDYYEI